MTITLQNTALGRRLSQSKYDRFSQSIPDALGNDIRETIDEFGVRRTASRRSNASVSGATPDRLQVRQTQSNRSATSGSARRPVIRKSVSGDPSNGGLRKLTPIPGSPYTTEHSVPSSPSSHNSKSLSSPKSSPRSNRESVNGRARSNGDVHFTDSVGQARGKSFTVRSQPQSLNAALEMLAFAEPDRKSIKADSPTEASFATVSSYKSALIVPSIDIQSDDSSGRSLYDIPPSPSSAPTKPGSGGLGGSKIAAKGISAPMPNHGKALF